MKRRFHNQKNISLFHPPFSTIRLQLWQIIRPSDCVTVGDRPILGYQVIRHIHIGHTEELKWRKHLPFYQVAGPPRVSFLLFQAPKGIFYIYLFYCKTMALAMRPPTGIRLLTGTRSLLSKDKDKDSSGSSGRNDSAYLKRREQVRKAQRWIHTHGRPHLCQG